MGPTPPAGLVVRADNLDFLAHVPDGSVDVVYVDPPFNTGRAQTRDALVTVHDAAGRCVFPRTMPAASVQQAR
jgi:site-specific DNA-methyltransferase (adenine-specific)